MSDPDIVERLRIDFAHVQRTGLASARFSKDEIGALFAEIDRLRADLATSMTTLAKAQALQAEMLKERAALAQTAAPGWQWVPVEPTEAMHASAVRTIVRCTGNDDWPPRVWRAMLAAAPQASQPAAPDDKLRKALEFIATHAADVVRTNSKDRGDWAEDMAYVGKVARDAVAAPQAPQAPQAGAQGA